MTKLIILRGNSGSGKTTTAKNLKQALSPKQSLLISQDVVRREMLRVKDYPDNLAIELMKRMALYGNETCEYVIIEGITRKEVYASFFEELLAIFDQTYCYYFDMPFEETVRRHSQRPNAQEISREDLKRWWNDNDLLNFEFEKRIPQSMTEKSCR